MRAAAGLTVAIVLAACGGAPAPVASSSSAVQSAPASTEPSEPASASRSSPTGTQTGALPHCKLPVATGDGTKARAGFLSLPDGSFTPDPRGDFDQSWAVQLGSPPLTGTWPRTNVVRLPTYDAAFDRWVPVSPAQISADGSRYVYQEWVMPDSQGGPVPPTAIRIHVVDVATAADRVVYSTSSHLFTVVAWQPEGVYLTQQCWEGCGFVGGMWLMDPATGALKTILTPDVDHTEWRWIAGGVAWGSGPTGGSNVFRLDLSSGKVLPWFTPAHAAGIAGLDPLGFPLVEAQDPASAAMALWDVTSASGGSLLYPPSGFAVFDYGLVDGGRTWVGGTAGLFELAPSGTLLAVRSGLTADAIGVAAAGPCQVAPGSAG